MDSPPKLVDIQTGVFYPISIYVDLKDSLEIMKTASLSIRPYQQQWYNTVFLPSFEEQGTGPNIKTTEYGTILAKESVVGLTTKDLADKMSKQGKTTSTTHIYENYLRPLTKQSYQFCSKYNKWQGKSILPC